MMQHSSCSVMQLQHKAYQKLAATAMQLLSMLP
jgi:hypothetical protein